MDSEDPSTTEEWRPVVGYEQTHEVSSLWRVRSLGGRASDGSLRIGKILTLDSWQGYLRAWLYCNGTRKKFRVHRLVLISFVGPCPDGLEACHGDTDKKNNRLSNLRWDTQQGNREDSIRHGKIAIVAGERHHSAKLTDFKVRLVLALLGCRARQKQIASLFAVGEATIGDIASGRSWAHIKR